MLDLRPGARVAFAAFWVLGQTALLTTASLRSDGIFGFRMFPEASTMEIHLSREVPGGVLAPAPRGEWAARDATGQLRHFSWRDRVRDPVLGSLDAVVFASYGVRAQLGRLQHALDDTADHIPEDNETRRLRAEVVFSRNGHEPTSVTLVSRARWGP